MMKDKISIIVPVYNAETYLEKCLNSLCQQSYTNLEVLLIDDGSKDLSAEICKHFAESDHRFRYIYQQNAGVSSARNKGLEMATGEYIGFCDSDDWVEPDMYESLYNLLQSDRADVSIVSYIKEVGETVAKVTDDKKRYIFDSHKAVLEMQKGELFGGHLWNKLIKADLINNLRFDLDIAVYEDTLFIWDVLYRAHKVVFQDLHKYHYRANPESVTASDFSEKHWTSREATNRLYKKMMAAYPENIEYTQRIIVVNRFYLAQKLALSGILTQDKYQMLVEDFKTHYNKKVELFFSKKFKKRYSYLLKGKLIFTYYVRILNICRKVKWKLLK